ncbi:hypothetical protein HMI55_004164 [Coelomomyces lativittatus]|nr:hypothetical protein HMI55_004164 [Coelomomyces lativittatus]
MDPSSSLLPTTTITTTTTTTTATTFSSSSSKSNSNSILTYSFSCLYFLRNSPLVKKNRKDQGDSSSTSLLDLSIFKLHNLPTHTTNTTTPTSTGSTSTTTTSSVTTHTHLENPSLHTYPTSTTTTTTTSHYHPPQSTQKNFVEKPYTSTHSHSKKNIHKGTSKPEPDSLYNRDRRLPLNKVGREKSVTSIETSSTSNSNSRDWRNSNPQRRWNEPRSISPHASKVSHASSRPYVSSSNDPHRTSNRSRDLENEKYKPPYSSSSFSSSTSTPSNGHSKYYEKEKMPEWMKEENMDEKNFETFANSPIQEFQFSDPNIDPIANFKAAMRAKEFHSWVPENENLDELQDDQDLDKYLEANDENSLHDSSLKQTEEEKSMILPDEIEIETEIEIEKETEKEAAFDSQLEHSQQRETTSVKKKMNEMEKTLESKLETEKKEQRSLSIITSTLSDTSHPLPTLKTSRFAGRLFAIESSESSSSSSSSSSLKESHEIHSKEPSSSPKNTSSLSYPTSTSSSTLVPSQETPSNASHSTSASYLPHSTASSSSSLNHIIIFAL